MSEMDTKDDALNVVFSDWDFTGEEPNRFEDINWLSPTPNLKFNYTSPYRNTYPSQPKDRQVVPWGLISYGRYIVL